MDTAAILRALHARFSDLIDYGDDDPEAPIDPLTYRAPEGDTCLHVAAMRGDSEALGWLLDLGVDIDAPGEMGSTALHYAAMFRHREAFDLLVRRGARCDLVNEFGNPSGAWERG